MSKKRYQLKDFQASGRRFHLSWFIAVWLLCDRLNIPEWLWGIYWAFTVLIVLLFLADVIIYDEVKVDITDLLKSIDKFKKDMNNKS